MKKTYFMRSFNFIIVLLFLGILSFVISGLLNGLLYLWQENAMLQKILEIVQICGWIQTAIKAIQLGGQFILLLAFVLVGIEWISRISFDQLKNSFKSIQQTILFRRFMKQSEKSEKIVDAKKITSFNPIIERFNHSTRKAVVDVHQNEVLVFIKVPSTQQTQRILKDLEAQIKEEVSSRNPDYIFSNFERYRHQLWLHGTRK